MVVTLLSNPVPTGHVGKPDSEYLSDTDCSNYNLMKWIGAGRDRVVACLRSADHDASQPITPCHYSILAIVERGARQESCCWWLRLACGDLHQ